MKHGCPDRCDVCGPACYREQQREVRPMPGVQIGVTLLALSFVLGFIAGSLGALEWLR